MDVEVQAATCPIYMTLAAIGGRWKPLIIYRLFEGTKRFSELKRGIVGVTQKMLTQQLRELERSGLVTRRVYPQVPPRVEYSLTVTGESLRGVMQAMSAWGERYRLVNGCRVVKKRSSLAREP
ncbi:MAG: transcriptional regulator [Luteitalea sp.]|nr:transcriptional regulator [Luteitalea sp.]